ncbi:hypothetical protein [Efunavirus EF1]|uniref:Uncharacterized protein n=1 Tax=Enterococcus phage EF1 TaxID=2025813 RepID=A0A249XXN4_9CAUD|nr:hypothetical protein [Enterococcus phage EF1]ASZ77448.1 hypothetical protein [Enterococcus phage EF5]
MFGAKLAFFLYVVAIITFMVLLAPIVLYLIWNFVVAIAFPGLFTLTFFQCFSITLLLTFIKAIFINKKSND